VRQDVAVFFQQNASGHKYRFSTKDIMGAVLTISVLPQNFAKNRGFFNSQIWHFWIRIFGQGDQLTQELTD